MTKEIKAHTKKVWQLKLEGASNTEIMNQLNMSESAVVGAIHRGRARGDLPKRKYLKPYDKQANSVIPRGTISNIIENLNENQNKWLVDEAIRIECRSISEHITEIIRDYYDEYIS